MQATSTDALVAQTIHALKKNWKEFLALPLITGLLLAVFSSGVSYLSFAYLPQMGGVSMTIIGLAGLIFMMSFSVATSLWCEKIYNHQTIDVSEGLKMGLGRILGTLGTSLLTLVKILLWSLLLFIPGYFKTIQYMLSVKAAHIEGVYGSVANARSQELVMKEGWLQTLGSTMSVTLVGIVVMEIIAGISALLRVSISSSISNSPWAMGIGAGLVGLIVYGTMMSGFIAYTVFLSFMFLNYRGEATPVKSRTKKA